MAKRKRIYSLVIALIMVLALLVADAVFVFKEISKSVRIYYVPLYDQKDTNWCWAYCQLMIEDANDLVFRSEKSADSRVAAIVREGYGDITTDEMGSPIGARDLHIKTKRELYDALCKYGPLYAEYDRFDKKGDRIEGHSIVITGIDMIRGFIYTNNPWGVRGKQTYEEFEKGFLNAEGDDWMFMGYYYLE